MSSASERDSGSEDYSGGERGFGHKKEKKEKKDKDKKEKKDKDKDKDKKDKDKKDKRDKKDKDKDKKDKKDKDEKDKKDKEKDKKHHDEAGHMGASGSSTSGYGFSGPGYGGTVGGGAAAEYLSSTSKTTTVPVASFQAHAPAATGLPPAAPPPYAPSPGFPQAGVDIKSPQFPGAPSTATNAPPSGYRVPLRTDSPFPGPDQTGPPVAYDADGVSPVFVGSALFETSVHPCKIGPHLQPYASVPYGGGEYGHHGRYDLLPFVPDQMEWVYTSYGRIPPGRRPIEGGYEENGGKLYHALANVNGINVPGKAGEHLGGANVAFGGQEHVFQEYQILCWK